MNFQASGTWGPPQIQQSFWSIFAWLIKLQVSTDWNNPITRPDTFKKVP